MKEEDGVFDDNDAPRHDDDTIRDRDEELLFEDEELEFGDDGEDVPDADFLADDDEEFVLDGDEWDLFGDEPLESQPDLVEADSEAAWGDEDQSDVPATMQPAAEDEAPVFGQLDPSAVSDDAEFAGNESVSGAGFDSNPDEEDLLFGAVGEVPENVLGENRTFSETGAGWDGDQTDLEELGVEMEGAEGEMAMHLSDDGGMFDIEDSEDLILIEDENDLEDSGAPAMPAQGFDVHRPLAGEFDEFEGAEDIAEEEFAADDGDYEDEAGYDADIDYDSRDFEVAEGEEEEDPEWAPVASYAEQLDSEEYDEEGEEVSYAYQPEDEDGDPDYSEHEEFYDNASMDQYRDKAPARSRFGLVAGLAATVLVSGSAAFWYFKKDLFGPGERTDVIEVVKVSRPTTKIDPDLPKNPEQVTPPVVEKPPVKVDPPVVVEKPPVKVDPPVVVETPKGGTPSEVVKTPDEASPPVVVEGPDQGGDPSTSPIPGSENDPKRVDRTGDLAGNQVQIGTDGSTVSGQEEGAMEKHRRTVVEEQNGLVMGSQALAQLHNENIFIGRVKRLNASLVTLSTKEGEVTLHRTDVRALTTLEAREYEEWRDVMSTGMVRLRNSNRLKGKIVEARDDAVVLMVNANRVIIPKSAIESVSSESNRSVNLTADEAIESDDWFRQLVEKRMEERDSKKVSGAATPGKSAAPTK